MAQGAGKSVTGGRLAPGPRAFRSGPALSGAVVGALALLAAGCAREGPAHAPIGRNGLGDPHRGAQVILRGACGSCHVIPGISLANGVAGPSLAGMGARSVVAGVLANTPQNMAAWLRDPQRFVPGAAMPADVLNDQEARDAAAYLATLEDPA